MEPKMKVIVTSACWNQNFPWPRSKSIGMENSSIDLLGFRVMHPW